MQIFIPYSSPIKVAKCLDPKRLNKQIIECDQIIKAIKGETKAWTNHPVVKMYSGHLRWVGLYKECLESYKNGCPNLARYLSAQADMIKPSWMTEALCRAHRRRLVAKDSQFYKTFWDYGISEINYYVVDNEVLGYIRGKKMLSIPLETFNEKY